MSIALFRIGGNIELLPSITAVSTPQEDKVCAVIDVISTRQRTVDYPNIELWTIRTCSTTVFPPNSNKICVC